MFLVVQCLHKSHIYPQESIITDVTLQSSPFTFLAGVGDSWLMEYDAPRSDMHPDPDKVAAVRANPEWDSVRHNKGN